MVPGLATRKLRLLGAAGLGHSLRHFPQVRFFFQVPRR